MEHSLASPFEDEEKEKNFGQTIIHVSIQSKATFIGTVYRSVPIAKMLPLGPVLVVEKVLRRLTGIREPPIVAFSIAIDVRQDEVEETIQHVS